MKQGIKTAIFATFFSLANVTLAQSTIEPPIAVGPIAQLDMTVRQSNLDIITTGDSSGTFPRGTIRNVATVDITNLQSLGDVLTGNQPSNPNGLLLRIRINDRGEVNVPILFEEGQDEVVVGRARVIDPTTFVDDGTLKGRIKANYDIATDTLVLRYAERVDLNTSATRFAVNEARRFSINMSFRFNDRSRGLLVFSAAGEAPMTQFGYLQ